MRKRKAEPVAALVRVFTKDNPCNKFDLWNCFRGKKGFETVPIVTARGIIGRHVPGHLIAAGRAVEVNQGDGIRLTKDGQKWLTDGAHRRIRSQTKKGFTAIKDLENPLSSWVTEFA